jgi:outer membrane usher protein
MPAFYVILILSGWAIAQITSVSAAGQPPPAGLALQLDVTVNGQRLNMLASFSVKPDGRIAVTPEELNALGFVLPGVDRRREVLLDQISGLKYTYDAERQAISIVAADHLLKPQILGPEHSTNSAEPTPGLTGAIINYGLTSSIYDDFHSVQPIQALSFDARLFGALGTATVSGFIGDGAANRSPYIRLDSTWTFANENALQSFRIGDVVSRGLAWTRPVRLGGGQVSSNFGLRPDLVTTALPAFRGSAAVPSTVDVFIDNTKVFSQDVRPGPFVITNLPTITGAGNANIVVRDSAGRETVQNASFYSSPVLLRSGIFDYSTEVGFVRKNYGVVSDDYESSLAGSGSLRYGLTDQVTLEAHAEAGSGVVNAGAGLSFSLMDQSLFSFSASSSQSKGDTGLQGFGAFETKLGPATLRLSTQRTFGGYVDLASTVAMSLKVSSGAPFLWSNSPPRALDIATVSFPLSEQRDNVSISLINRELPDLTSRLMAISYSRALYGSTSFILNAFRDVESANTGVFAGISMPLGDAGSVQLGYSRTDGGAGDRGSFSADYSKTAGREPGALGWRLADRGGERGTRQAAVTYQGSVARVEGGIDQSGGQSRGRMNVDGSVVLIDGGLFLANRIDDSFAVVDAGAPGVDVLLENRAAATTGDDGRALVTGLRSFQRNTIAINPDTLPVDATARDTRSVAVPGDRNGVLVDLKVSRAANAAIVVFRGGDGAFLPVGSQGILKGNGATFVIGFDGRSYIDGLTGTNSVTIETGSATCAAEFAFAEKPGSQVVIEGVACR